VPYHDQSSQRAFDSLDRLQKAVDKLTTRQATPDRTKAVRRDHMVTPDATKALALAREELDRVRSLNKFARGETTKVADPNGAEIMKRALGGDPDAQRVVRQAVQLANSDQVSVAKAAYAASVTGRPAENVGVIAGLKGATPLPNAYGPHSVSTQLIGEVPKAEISRAIDSMANLPRDAVLPAEVVQRLRAAGVPLATGRASDLFAWLGEPAPIDLATRLPIPQPQRRLPNAGNTGNS